MGRRGVDGEDIAHRWVLGPACDALSRLTELQQATSEGNGDEQEPRPADRHARNHVGEPMNAKKHTASGDRTGKKASNGGS